MTTKKTALEEHDDALNEEQVLAGVPALLPAEQFRQRQRSAITKMFSRLRGVIDDDGNVDLEDEDTLALFLDLLADADEFFETIAADKAAYAEWSTGLKDSEQIFGTLIAKYGRAVGE
ncbi:hypothetical protein ACFJGV_15165 [Cnuibacter sp. UC19_7]|uniref:hypothetical protein n=1 Tax=Cnuibacter sp. UC19_7 TaxID=3350166 RepID=UPI00366C95CB